jgi:hypothetical protein
MNGVQGRRPQRDEPFLYRGELRVPALVRLRVHRVADAEAGHLRTDRLDLACDIPADGRLLGPPEPECEADHPWLAMHQ